MVSSDGEYQWEKVVPAAHVPALLAAVDAPADVDFLRKTRRPLDRRGSYDLEPRIRDSDNPVRLWTYGG